MDHGPLAQFESTAALTAGAYWRYFNRLKELAISSILWEDVPDSVDDTFLEKCLFDLGSSLYFNEGYIGNLVSKATISGPPDFYGYPTIRTAFSENGYNRTFGPRDSVIIYNNMLRMPTLPEVDRMARKLAELDAIVEVNCKAQKTPVLIACDDSERMTLKNLYLKYDGNQPFIFGKKNLRPDSIKAITTGAPYVADRIYQLKVNYWNEALTYLGIPNVALSKKERLVRDEVNRSQGGTLASRFSRLKARQDAVKKINAMFGANIKVSFRDFSDEALALPEGSGSVPAAGGEIEGGGEE